MKNSALYLSAQEAAAELAISPATLYAYVSRGPVSYTHLTLPTIYSV